MSERGLQRLSLNGCALVRDGEVVEILRTLTSLKTLEVADAHRRHICTRTGPTPAHISAGTGPTPAHISAGTGPTPAHLCRNGARPCHICNVQYWAHPAHICTRTRLALATSAAATIRLP